MASKGILSLILVAILFLGFHGTSSVFQVPQKQVTTILDPVKTGLFGVVFADEGDSSDNQKTSTEGEHSSQNRSQFQESNQTTNTQNNESESNHQSEHQLESNVKSNPLYTGPDDKKYNQTEGSVQSNPENNQTESEHQIENQAINKNQNQTEHETENANKTEAEHQAETENSDKEIKNENNNLNATRHATEHDLSDIAEAKTNQTIAAQADIGTGNVTAKSIDNNVVLKVENSTTDAVNMTVSASSQSGPKVILINLNSTTIDVGNVKYLHIMYDGQPIEPAASVADVLHPTSSGPPRFAILVTQSGAQILISIPHFSTHTITITSLSKVIPSVPEFGPLTGIVSILAVISVVIISRKAKFYIS
ncbi:hypothetical protein [Candidatus Nitrosotalea okcheonensis]|uniref:PEFG-CTERM sorting domain-containing protein n=1 Tax=Candidatus Nitrosotalea okcheonensis TaxID=1903276 RepID=A0A2H1FI12_9ARCH|nr:hypothetical protein [Candidatus Nitrosotalea okcheonensis]MDE1727762.1 hypothetical protein [Nitrososphaerota archaeon]SMH72403.1 exported protein of unknown function [Candidatus Nitrosotalea okcheonensis]